MDTKRSVLQQVLSANENCLAALVYECRSAEEANTADGLIRHQQLILSKE
jgi:hypothetical protein